MFLNLSSMPMLVISWQNYANSFCKFIQTDRFRQTGIQTSTYIDVDKETDLKKGRKRDGETWIYGQIGR
jgi:hypothetical protein